MVTVGGITRLTKSGNQCGNFISTKLQPNQIYSTGLSMTDWTVQGSLPPITLEEWNNEFERYKMYPEWRQRQSMTLDEFKFIYYWEYGHRMMGRMLGIAYGIPLLYFAMSKKIPSVMYTRLGLLFTLGGTQVATNDLKMKYICI
jgi:cytochrome c oxidase assembly protein subunit 15